MKDVRQIFNSDEYQRYYDTPYEAFKAGWNAALKESARRAGSSKSEKKAKASRENGKKGGRPKK